MPTLTEEERAKALAKPATEADGKAHWQRQPKFNSVGEWRKAAAHPVSTSGFCAKRSACTGVFQQTQVNYNPGLGKHLASNSPLLLDQNFYYLANRRPSDALSLLWERPG